MSKLFGGWCLLMLSLPLTFFWLKPDVKAGGDTAVLLKLFVLLGFVSAIALAVSHQVSRKWAQRTVQLQNFVAALPSSQTPLPAGGPEELQNLARAMRAMAERVRQVVERANLELSRRET